MKDLDKLSHHAYCLIGSNLIRQDLEKVLETKHKVTIQGNPDFYARKYETFTIDDARQIKAAAESRPVIVGGKKFFILEMNAITVEAQNAMLKLLEEPAEYTHFFLILPSAHLLLPTIKSRISFIETANAEHEVIPLEKEAKALLAAPVAKRLDMVKSFMDEITKEKRPKQDAIDLLGALEELVHEKTQVTTGGKSSISAGLQKNTTSLEAIMLARKYSTDRAPSLKMLLEYVAMSI